MNESFSPTPRFQYLIVPSFNRPMNFSHRRRADRVALVLERRVRVERVDEHDARLRLLALGQRAQHRRVHRRCRVGVGVTGTDAVGRTDRARGAVERAPIKSIFAPGAWNDVGVELKGVSWS